MILGEVVMEAQENNMNPKDQITQAREEIIKQTEDFVAKKIILSREEILAMMQDYKIALDGLLAMIDAAILNKK
jgi:hypothetical protein